MAKLYFRYSTMNAGKSLDILRVAHNYEELGLRPFLIMPEIYGKEISSRTGLSKRANILIDSTANLALEVYAYRDKINCVIVDEAQSLTENQVYELAYVVDELNIPVICYGLRTNFRGELWEGSRYLLTIADKIEEIKTLCWCGNKATMVARIIDGKITKSGPDVLVKDTDDSVIYKPLCRKHFNQEEWR